MRIDDSTGVARIRASSHQTHSDWTRWRGWSRVSYGSHAGHIPDPRDLDERTTTAAGVRVVPIESLTSEERETAFEVSPPWEKRVYTDPKSRSTG